MNRVDVRTLAIDAAKHESSRDVSLIAEQILLQECCGTGHWYDATCAQPMKLQLAGDHVGDHFCVGSCSSTAAAERVGSVRKISSV